MLGDADVSFTIELRVGCGARLLLEIVQNATAVNMAFAQLSLKKATVK